MVTWFTLIMQNHVYAIGLFIATHFQNYYWTQLYLYRTKIDTSKY